jgi:glycosyltransferase involved in cell wall biosynthesis
MTAAILHRSAPPKGIRYVALWENSGYSEAARRQIVGLKHAGVPLCWTPLRRGSLQAKVYTTVLTRCGDPELEPVCNAQVEHDWVLVHTVPEYFPAWSIDADGRRRAGITVWETDRLPHSWPPLLNRMDRLFVPCRFNRDTFVKDGVRKPIHLLPHIAPAGAPPARQDGWGIPPSHFVFYTINTWTTRKAIHLTIRSYLNAFTARDPVTLVIKTTREDLTRPGLGERWHVSTRRTVRAMLGEYRDPAAVVLLDQKLSATEMLALHARGDCYVSLTRSEGWGLGAFDAAAYGTPVIITDYGGQLDYLQPQPAGLVRSTLVPVCDPPGYPSFAPDQNWAEPSLQHASDLMRAMVEAPDRARDNAAGIRAFIHDQFNEKRVTEGLLRELENRS